MGLHDIVKIPTTISLLVIVLILAGSIFASFQVTKDLAKPKKKPAKTKIK
jgi:hypothetical protein